MRSRAGTRCAARSAAAARDGGIGGPAGEELRRGGDRARARRRAPKRCCARWPAIRTRDRGHGPLDTLVAAVLLQRDAGGDLAGLLRELAAALEERARVLADARSATAQARFTALLVSALPAVALAIAELAGRASWSRLVASPLSAGDGRLALVAAGDRVSLRSPDRRGQDSR